MRKRLPILVAIICLWAMGCDANLKPRGRLLKKGAPFAPSDTEAVHVTFFPDVEQPDHDPYPARVNREDGTFQVLGVDGKGLPPGKYRATVQLTKNRKDVFNGAYNRIRSPFKIDLTSSTGEITLDLEDPSAGSASQPQGKSVRREQQKR
jgi:hypothetical protein